MGCFYTRSTYYVLLHREQDIKSLVALGFVFWYIMSHMSFLKSDSSSIFLSKTNMNALNCNVLERHRIIHLTRNIIFNPL